MRVVVCIFALATIFGCATGPKAKPRAVPSTAKIAIEVEKESILAPGFHKDLAAQLRKQIQEAGAGVVVVDAAKADWVLKYRILGANFTEATAWEWQLVERESGVVLKSNADTAAFGATAETLANRTVVVLVELDSPAASGVASGSEPSRKSASTMLTPPRSQTDGKDAWAVVVGIETYRDSIPAATGARADALAFANYARTTLNVPEQNIKVLLDDRATGVDLKGALDEWLPRNAKQPGSVIYVFFSGHGAPDVESGDAYLVPWDASPAYIKSGGVAVAPLMQRLASLEKPTFVFLDACFSGAGERSVLAEGTRPLVPVKDVAPASGVVTFGAAGASETTGAHAGGSHGLFTFHLLEGLGGAADLDGDGNVTVQELGTHVSERVTLDARRQNRDQHPTVRAKPRERDYPLVRGLSR